MLLQLRKKLVRPFSVSLFISLAAFGLVYYWFATIADTTLAGELSAEDGAFEMFGALCFLGVSLQQLRLFFASDLPKKQRLVPFFHRNVFMLGLAVMFFFAFGEEISWGQRIFGWQTPDAILETNQQQETNIHNLVFFHGESLLNMSRMFSLFWFGYCVVLPILSCISERVSGICNRISLPVPPVWIAGLFVGCYGAFRIYVGLMGTETLGNANEIKESFLALCFLILSAARTAPERHSRVERVPLDLRPQSARSVSQ
ncbi:MAG: DMSO/TMAO reductase YedYZ heme-binding membrane subunit [Verrucomicrobiales bacterium]|jgi:DMSO/TMAO reductase YedYZ heme-binding membrane subunit